MRLEKGIWFQLVSQNGEETDDICSGMGQDAQYIMPILSFIGLIDFKGETHSISQNNWHEFAASISDLDKLHFESY